MDQENERLRVLKVIDFIGYELLLEVKGGITLPELKKLIKEFKETHQEVINKKYLSVPLQGFFQEKGYDVAYIKIGPTIDLRKP